MLFSFHFGLGGSMNVYMLLFVAHIRLETERVA